MPIVNLEAAMTESNVADADIPNEQEQNDDLSD